VAIYVNCGLKAVTYTFKNAWDMDLSDDLPGELKNRRDRFLGMERDLQFLYFLLRAPIYQKQSPNLYERLREFGSQAGELEESLRQSDWEREGELEVLEEKVNTWKSGLYEFLESKI
jgi:hypothetical protein